MRQKVGAALRIAVSITKYLSPTLGSKPTPPPATGCNIGSKSCDDSWPKADSDDDPMSSGEDDMAGNTGPARGCKCSTSRELHPKMATGGNGGVARPPVQYPIANPIGTMEKGGETPCSCTIGFAVGAMPFYIQNRECPDPEARSVRTCKQTHIELLAHSRLLAPSRLLDQSRPCNTSSKHTFTH